MSHQVVSGQDILLNVLIFAMASFLGLELIRHVSRLLHTPLMSLTNALSSVAVIAALIVMDEGHKPKPAFIVWLGVIAVACSACNAVGGFMITERILRMFRPREGSKKGAGTP